jgi:hypothetical protein
VTVVDVTDMTALSPVAAGDDSPLIVVHHDVDTAAVRRAASVLAGARPDHPLARIATGHAPVAAIEALATAREATDDPGDGCLLTRRGLGAAWSLSVVTTVAGLGAPQPSLAQHVRSWLPRARFAIRHAPDPAVLRLADLTGPGRPVADGARLVACGGSGGGPGAGPGSGDDGLAELHARVLELVDATEVVPRAVPGDHRHVYGVGRASAVRAHYGLVRPPSRPPAGRTACPHCGLRTGPGTCPFCSARTPGRRPGTARVALRRRDASRVAVTA